MNPKLKYKTLNVPALFYIPALPLFILSILNYFTAPRILMTSYNHNYQVLSLNYAGNVVVK